MTNHAALKMLSKSSFSYSICAARPAARAGIARRTLRAARSAQCPAASRLAPSALAPRPPCPPPLPSLPVPPPLPSAPHPALSGGWSCVGRAAYPLDVVDDARHADAHEAEEEERHEQRGEGALERVGQHRRALVVPDQLEQPQQPQQTARTARPLSPRRAGGGRGRGGRGRALGPKAQGPVAAFLPVLLFHLRLTVIRR